MIAPRTLAELIDVARVTAVQDAIVDTLKPLFPGIGVRRHPGRMDLTDLAAKDIYPSPTIAVGWTRLRAARHLEGTFGVLIELAAYIIVEDMPIANKRVERDVLGQAVGDGILDVIGDRDTNRWGLEDISDPLDRPEPELKPVFTVKTFERGVALYAVTWHQTLLRAGNPIWDFASPPRPEFELNTILPGDPDPGPGPDEGGGS